MSIANPWSVLGVDRSASEEDVRAAFRVAARKHHPDKGGDPEAFARVTEAYGLIKTRKLARLFLQKLAVSHDGCSACKGTGTKRITKKFTAVATFKCPECDGLGYKERSRHAR